MSDDYEVDKTLLKKKKPEVRMSIEQQHAVELGTDTSKRLVGITGSAGTGKTFVLGQLHKELKAHGELVTLCAPTGRAAKRIQELTGIPAKTIHRLLEFPMPGDPTENQKDAVSGEPKRRRGYPIDAKVVIVDESSMLSPTLYRQLLDAMPAGGCVRFFGDNRQLPPVEEGTPPFLDILENQPSVELTYNYRSDDFIVSNAQLILRGRMPERNPQFEIIYSHDPIRELVQFATKEFMDMDHQIIMPTRKGKAGTVRVNPSLQLKFNGKGKMLRLDRFDEKEAPLVIRGGDKYLWIKNDYKLEMFNGEIGKVDWVNEEDGTLKVLTADREILVPAEVRTYSPWHGHMISYDPRKQIELGYAITTHKSQGSEFHTIIYCMSAAQAYLLNRRNFYTGITRAKHQVIIICDRKAMGLSLRPYKAY